MFKFVRSKAKKWTCVIIMRLKLIKVNLTEVQNRPKLFF